MLLKGHNISSIQSLNKERSKLLEREIENVFCRHSRQFTGPGEQGTWPKDRQYYQGYLWLWQCFIITINCSSNCLFDDYVHFFESRFWPGSDHRPRSENNLWQKEFLDISLGLQFIAHFVFFNKCLHFFLFLALKVSCLPVILVQLQMLSSTHWMLAKLATSVSQRQLGLSKWIKTLKRSFYSKISLSL